MKTCLDKQDNEPRFIFNLSIEEPITLQLHNNLLETYKDVLVLNHCSRGYYLFCIKFDILATALANFTVKILQFIKHVSLFLEEYKHSSVLSFMKYINQHGFIKKDFQFFKTSLIDSIKIHSNTPSFNLTLSNTQSTLDYMYIDESFNLIRDYYQNDNLFNILDILNSKTVNQPERYEQFMLLSNL